MIRPSELIAHLMAMEADIPGLTSRYKLRPRAITDFPAIYHTIPSPSTHQQHTTGTGRDVVMITSRIVVRYIENDPGVAGEQLLELTDAYLEHVDPHLWNDDLPSGLQWQKRTGFAQGLDEFNGIAALAMDFQLVFELDRPIR